MGWKITARFLATVIAVVVMVTIINIVAVLGILATNRQAFGDRVEDTLHGKSPEDFSRGFNAYIEKRNSELFVKDEGKRLLDENEAWIQILDEKSSEVYSYKKPQSAPVSYTPFEIVHGYKYSGVIGGNTTIFMGEKSIDGVRYSYIVAFPMSVVKKEVFVYENEVLLIALKRITVFTLIADSVIALFFGYIFSRRLTRPVGRIIEGVERLEYGDYETKYEPKGVYSAIYKKLNNLADTLRIGKEEQSRLAKMRDEWIANISHDIKTPLASIKGYGELLADDYEFSRDEMRSYAQVINQKADYIKSLVDDLNLSTRLRGGFLAMDKKEINIVTLVREAVIQILNDPIYSGRSIELECGEENIFKAGDETLLKRLVNNIIYNSILHNDENVGIKVEVKRDDRVRIFIRDNGRGIGAQDIEHIFERYYRGTDTGERHKGSGLGMAIAMDIAKAHGGDIRVSSILGQGTETEIIL